MAGYAPLTRPTKTKTPVGRVKTRHAPERGTIRPDTGQRFPPHRSRQGPLSSSRAATRPGLRCWCLSLLFDEPRLEGQKTS